MQKIFYTIFICIVIYSFLPNPVLAHVLQTSGSVGVVMHIDPEDDPIVGRESGIFFEFKDKNNAFVSSDCLCVMTISSNGTSVFTTPLFQHEENKHALSTMAMYTFPQQGVYTITVTGDPKTKGAFQSFKVSNDIRVSRQEKESTMDHQQNSNFFWVGVVLLFVLPVSYFLLQKLKKRKILCFLFLVGSLIFHLIPPSIAASHSQHTMSVNDHSCCLPQAFILPTPIILVEPLPVAKPIIVKLPTLVLFHLQEQIRNRSPPLFPSKFMI